LLDEEKIHITPAALRADALFSLSLVYEKVRILRAPRGSPCVGLEAAITAARAALTGEDPKRRRATARRAIEAMASRRLYQVKNDWLWAT
jgi:hypothetical protein